MITRKLTRTLAATIIMAGAFLTATAQNIDDLAARGPSIAAQDPLAIELREQQPEGLPRRGFDIGMAAAEGQTLPGPGKQRIHDALSRQEQGGFRVAVLFSLERNNNLNLATVGARITSSNERIAAARNAESDVFFKLGFDIATGIFGDRALGALGNTLTGPGSLKIRDSLSSSGQRGFNAAVRFLLGQPPPSNDGGRDGASDSTTDRGGPVRVNDPPTTGTGRVIDRNGPGQVIDSRNSTLPNISKPLIISAAGTAVIYPVPSGKINVGQDTMGQIAFTVSYEDGTPFPLAKPDDIKVSLVASTSNGSREPLRLAEGGEGLWRVMIPKLSSGSHLYLISVVVDAKAWRTTFQGRSVVRVDYTRMPFWNAQRSDGTIWDPPR